MFIFIHVTPEPCHLWVMSHMSHVSHESCVTRVMSRKKKERMSRHTRIVCWVPEELSFHFSRFPSGPLVPMLLKILPKISIFTEMQISDFPVSRSTNSNNKFVLISICTEETEFATVAIFGGVAFPEESIMLELAVILRIILFCFWF